ncbi:MAG: VWA domain-containing protein [Nanoarchaeota archaeon]|nr:VWA domain-containing protein [Nanoarchaeota archaeon]
MNLTLGNILIERPTILFWIIPLFLFFLIYIKKNITPQPRLPRFSRAFFILSRTIIFLLLLAALAGPYTQQQDITQGDPSVTLIIDNSSSMSIFNTATATTIEQQLKKLVEVNTITLGTPTTSNIGDTILDHMQKGGSILLISDGNNNAGTTLGDVALHATKINATINSIALVPQENDASISIIGPNKVSAEVENIFKIQVQATQQTARHIIITLDNEIIIDTISKEETFTFSRVFLEGYHTITATIDDKDYFLENNQAYKVIKVIPKPLLAFLNSKETTPLLQLLNKIYNVQIIRNINELPSKSLALLVNDIDAATLDKGMNTIRDYVTDGNGLYIIGGTGSYEKGGYKGSMIESILPVTVGSAENKGEKINVIIAMDISKSTSQGYGKTTGEDVEKALAISAIDNINDQSNVGFIAFNTKPYIVSELSPLGPKREELVKKIKSLIDLGDTYLPTGMQKGIELLTPASGGKNLIIISDGKSGGFGLANNLAQEAIEKGIKIYLIGVGYDEDSNKEVQNNIYGQDYLKMVSSVSGGIYFRGNEAAQKINILFGDPQKNKENRQSYVLVILDDNHFITQDLSITPTIYGYNQVLPKPTGKLLATLDNGVPLLTVWRYGLGRIATLTTDDGSYYAANLLTGENNILFTRSINWAIGDPERNLEHYITIEDARVNENAIITAKQTTLPEVRGLSFYKTEDNIYQATFLPEKTGIHNILGVPYAVNYPREYEDLGMNKELETTVKTTGGMIFQPEQLQEMATAIINQSKQPIDKKHYYRWILIAFAIIIYLIEIFTRKIIENTKRNALER